MVFKKLLRDVLEGGWLWNVRYVVADDEADYEFI